MPYTYKHGDQPLEGVTVQRAVGRGGFGEVYYALTDSGKQVALKYLRENADVELRGIGHVMNLKSPHLVTIYDVRKSNDGEPFVIMEYVGGPSLRDMLVAEPEGMPVQKAAYLFRGIAQGLVHLHEQGIVHRDLKPANIFYDDGYIKIGDYGLSKHISVSKHSGQTVSVGTVHYMAPEIGSGSYTKAIDIYALGVILYEMLTGRLPYTGSSMAEILMRHVRDNPDLSHVPAPFAPIVAKALAKEPAERYQDANEMLDAVMASGELEEQAKSFDATALTQVPRSEDSDDAQTRTVPTPPVPNMDAREAAGQWGADMGDRMRKRLDKLGQRLEHKARAVERKLGPGPGGQYHYERQGRQIDPDKPRVHRLPQMIILGVITIMVSVLLGMLYGRNPEEHTLTFVFYLIGGTVGPLAAYLWLLHYSPTRSTGVDRLVLAAAGGAGMLPATLIAAEEMRSTEMWMLIFPLVGVLLICDWTRRIQAGRAGQVEFGDAVWPGILAFIIGLLADCDGYAFAGAVMAATLSLLVQAAAAMWPISPQERQRRGGLPGPGPGPRPQAVGVPPVPPMQQRVPHPQHPAGAAPTPPAAQPAPPPAGDKSGGENRHVQPAQPSFVGAAANAGILGLGKLLLMLSVVLALGQGVLTHAAREGIASGSWNVDPDVAPLITSGLPMGFILLPMILGLVLLLLGRRGGGTLHVLRGFVGGGFILLGSIMAMTAGRLALITLFTQTSVDNVSDEDWVALIMGVVLPLGLGLLLMLVPPKNRQRTIVV